MYEKPSHMINEDSEFEESSSSDSKEEEIEDKSPEIKTSKAIKLNKESLDKAIEILIAENFWIN